MERVGLEALLAMQAVIPRNGTRKGSGVGRRMTGERPIGMWFQVYLHADNFMNENCR